MKNISCLICFEDNAEAIIKREFQKHGICDNCGFVYMNAIIPFTDNVKYYESNYWEGRDTIVKESIETLKKIEESVETSKSKSNARIINMYEWLHPKLIKGNEILEIGSGFGYNLAYIKSKSDCNVEALEPSKSAVDFLATEYAIKGYCTTLEDFKSDKKYDVIIMCHVLEHFEDPKNALRICFDLLKENGLIWIEVPNILNPNPTKKLDNWLAKEHISYFSMNKLEYIIGKEKFNLIRKEEDIYVRLLAKKSNKSIDVELINESQAVKKSLAKQRVVNKIYRVKQYLYQIKNKILK